MKLLLALSFFVSSVSAFAFPKAPFNALETKVKRLKGIQNQYDFEGIVKLSNCSGSLVKFSGQPDTMNAYVLTNGHCLSLPGGFLKPGEVVTNRTVNRRMRIFDRNMKAMNVTATKILYGTMTNTDSAIYQLKETYKQIEDRGIRPYLLDTTRPVVGANIEIISGYWERGYRCHIDGFVFKLLEAGWTFTDSIRYSEPGCDTIGGTSGSPIIADGTKVVVGINNTGNDSGERCTMNNPCEMDEDGNITVRKKWSYGQQTYNFYTCLTPDFRIDTTLSGCELPK